MIKRNIFFISNRTYDAMTTNIDTTKIIYRLNGLFLFAPNTINKVMMSPDEPVTICELMNQPDNQVNMD